MSLMFKGRTRLALLAMLPLAGLTGLAACGGGGGGGASIAKGNAAHGKELYIQCAGCHQGVGTLVGPQHCGVMGRKAASIEGFAYSDAMAASGLTWDDATMDAFLTSPISYVTGTNMGFAGFTEASDRADLIAYLHEMNNDKTICP